MSKMMFLTLSCFLVVASASLAQQSSSEVTTPFFGNKACPISGKATKASLFVKHGNEKIYVCCKTCVKKVTATPKAFHAKAYPAAKVVDLKNAKCPVMGNKVNPKVSITFQGHRVGFCCPGCDKVFLEEPNKHLAKLTSKPALTDLGNKTCPVRPGSKVKADSFFIYRNQIINTCCAGCESQFAKNPKKYLAGLKNAKMTPMWTCSMHPEVMADKQGKCPKCKMSLIPVKPGKNGKQGKHDHH